VNTVPAPALAAATSAALSVKGLRVVTSERQPVELVRGVDLQLDAGGSLGIVGESGSGKSLTLRAIMGILPRGLSAFGEASLGDQVIPLQGRRLSRSRRGRLGMVFQDPLAALDPVMTIGDQVAEYPRRVGKQSRAAARRRAIELLTIVRLPDPEGRAGAYPHQLSGGLRQRVMIAVALSTDPAVLLCDEPTTALDVTIQAEILALLDDLRRHLGVAIMFVSHDLAVVSEVCDNVVVMYSGGILEAGPVQSVLRTPRHPYTLGLLRATPDVRGPLGLPEAIPGALPDPAHRPPGCPFAPRCALVEPACRTAPIPLMVVGDAGAHLSACRRHQLLSPTASIPPVSP
jgi:peptide/nickel transport system ATP-binding protein